MDEYAVSPLLAPLIGQTVVIDLVSPYVCLGTLVGLDRDFLELHDADLHDFRDSAATRESTFMTRPGWVSAGTAPGSSFAATRSSRSPGSRTSPRRDVTYPLPLGPISSDSARRLRRLPFKNDRSDAKTRSAGRDRSRTVSWPSRVEIR